MCIIWFKAHLPDKSKFLDEIQINKETDENTKCILYYNSLVSNISCDLLNDINI